MTRPSSQESAPMDDDLPYPDALGPDSQADSDPSLMRVEWEDGRILQAGEYAKAPTGKFYAATPSGMIANLALHDVTEHEDGTITVSPSILVQNGQGQSWHGYLERGVWREV